MGATAPRWQRLEHDERREQILVVARRLVAERPSHSISMTEIAREAGVTRGLLNHYFGTKRDLELELLRQIVHVPEPAAPEDVEDIGLHALLSAYMDDWLTMVQRNREMWLAALGAAGFGRDPEVEAILDDAREQAAARIVAPVVARDPSISARDLQPLVRAFSGLAEDATREWLQRRRLTRAQVHLLLTETLLTLINDVAPKVGAAGKRR
jgi:AcrR family transcriptional regulator